MCIYVVDLRFAKFNSTFWTDTEKSKVRNFIYVIKILPVSEMWSYYTMLYSIRAGSRHNQMRGDSSASLCRQYIEN